MSKRRADSEAPGASPPSKLRIELPDDAYIDDADDDFTTAQTASSDAAADSPGTAATTPRPKFPSDLKTLACTWPGCPKTFNRPARLRDHLNSHTNSRPFKCPYDDCDKDYIEDKHLKQHVKAVHTHERKHVCQREGCGKSFVTGTRLKRHQAVHDGADRFRCQDCGHSFRKRDTLNTHIRKEHQGLSAYLCSEPGCSEDFDSKGALKRHRDREHGELRYWCSECAANASEDGGNMRVGFTTEVLLQAHIKREHQNCMFCDFKSGSQWELEKHVEMHHSGKTVEDRKTEACPHEGCDKKFTKKSNLNAHMRSAHEGVRYVCGEVTLTCAGIKSWSNDEGCGRKFSTKARLEDHVRFVHLGKERPKLSRMENALALDPVDELSGVAFEAKQNIHCLHCDERFARYFDLETHLNRQHAAGNDADPGSFLESELGPDSPAMFGDDPDVDPAWASDVPQEEIFAAQMDYGPMQDDWPEDEANIMLLAREMPELDASIDPALMCGI